jgi:hypothetical protein
LSTSKKIKVRIKENSLRARISAFKLKTPKVAMVWGNTILLFNVSKVEFMDTTPWLLHELRHIFQVQKMGKFVFLWRYLFLSLRYGYYNHPYEVDARLHENDVSMLEKVEFV